MMKIRVFAGMSSLAVTLAGLTVAGPPQQELRPLTREPVGPVEAAQGKGQAANQEPPMFYYNGDSKVFLFDTGLAVARADSDAAAAEVASLAAAVATEGTPLERLKSVLHGRRLVVVRTRGTRGMSLRPADRSPGVDHILPILRENTRPVVPPAQESAESLPVVVMTPEISARFSDAFFEGVTGAEARRAKVGDFLDPFGLKIAAPTDRSLRIPNAYVLNLKEGPVTYTRLLDAANRLQERGRASNAVVYAKPNFIRPVHFQQTGPIQDPRFPNQWHLNNTGQGQGGLVDADVDALDAWRVTEGTPTIRVAVIDDSVQKSHPDLAPNYQTGRYYKPDGGFEDDPSPRDGFQRHGTSCAGVAVAAANDIGGRGVAPRCGLIGVNFFDSQTDQQVADAFYFAADPDGDPATADGAAVISCSWGMNPAVEPPVELTTAIDEVARTGRNGKGIVILFASGNEFREISRQQKLGARESVICVGATNFRDVRSFYSNFGPELDVVAPSNDVRHIFNDPNRPDFAALAIDTTDNTDDQPRIPNNDRSGYAVGDYTGSGASTGFGGTSSATPLAAGVCALILSANPDLTALQARSVLEHTCDRVRGPISVVDTEVQSYDLATSHNIYYGYGRVNASRAVLAARQARTSPGSLWPDHVLDFSAKPVSAGLVRLAWKNPADGMQGVLVVASSAPIRWKPRDGDRFRVGDSISAVMRVVHDGNQESVTAPADQLNPTYYAIFAYSPERSYSWGQTATFVPPLPLPAPSSAPAVTARPSPGVGPSRSARSR